MSGIEPYLARTTGLGEKASVAEMIANGLIPGREGITLTDKAVRFGDLHLLSQKTGVEYALSRETVHGEKIFRLYSGGRNAVTTPRASSNVRLIGHTHPSGVAHPSGADLRSLNVQFLEALEKNPFAPVPYGRVIYGSGNTESTLYYPTVLR